MNLAPPIRAHIFHSFLLISIVYVIFFVILDYDKNWISSEKLFQTPIALSNGPWPLPGDFLRSFDFGTFDGGVKSEVYRTRFLDYFLFILNAKFRFNLFRFMPFHASLSIVWFFTYLLIPVYLLKLLNNLTEDKKTVLIACALYLVSVGFLSGNIMLFHPGKPMTNFIVIYALYLASMLNSSVKNTRIFGAGDLVCYVKLLLVLFFGCFLDETAWFAFLVIPVLFREIFFLKRRAWAIWITFIGTFGLFLTFITFVAPEIIQALGFGHSFSFWTYSYKINSRLIDYDFGNFFENSYRLIASHVLPFSWQWETLSLRGGLTLMFSALFLQYRALMLPKSQQSTLRRMLFVLLLFLIFQSLLMTRHLVILPFGGFYYGMLFSLFFVLPVSVLLSSGTGLNYYINIGVIAILIVVFITNFNGLNRKMKDGEMPYTTHELDKMRKTGKMNFSIAYKVWKNRDNVEALEKMKSEVPRQGYWLFYEAENYH